jgi:polyhydroxybutyrate depolymerase
MQLALMFFGIFVILIFLGWVVFKLQDHTNGTLLSAGEKRAYLLYVPRSYDPNRPTPLVITFHGFAQWPAHQMHISRWNDLAEEDGFIVVYPGGTRFPKRWRTNTMPDRKQDPSPDIQFISDLIDKLEAEYNIDARNIFVNGLSNGGGMSFLLSCVMAGRIAAVGIVAGALPGSWENCQPCRPVPVMMFHGTADPIVPYGGGHFRRTGTLPAIPEWVAALAHYNGCQEAPRNLPRVGQVSGIEYTGCGADVIFYTVEGGGHTWPGGNTIPAWIAGATNMDVDATRMFWEFFQKHPLPKPEVPSTDL